MAKYCVYCGNKLNKNDISCSKCGEIIEKEENKKELEKTTKDETIKITNNITTTSNSNGMAIAGFVTSLVSSVLCCGAFNIVGLVLSIIGLIQSKDLNGNGKGLSIAGIIISISVFVLMILYIIFMFGVSFFGTIFSFMR